ncbi:hypothetical protein J2W97_004246 [Paenibacillus jamilae]|jgi:hypothetical protein|uniref:hypothetical protein n=1 Tax=Paenibacillus TaxID=44249 RepID=UPI000D2FEC98|nr:MULTISPECIES: hypothetical protein [Paenibacillus]MDP9678216.1 hypothetical protein [Paenibacillus jamilae]KAF6614401.1 hypothetical protein HFE00_25040 [Paenibacillus sp. EKM101P]KAF6616642.1 hypothetical protein HFE03_25610 [Paenibacillus sp. EKM102P]KAF6625499.1 hypothetical protein HFE01_24665 [Paenibacillus sp. EKM10P]KAF6641737.1 hypothetical protein HFE02_24540 [Paenibacillus sp. EKM11P]
MEQDNNYPLFVQVKTKAEEDTFVKIYSDLCLERGVTFEPKESKNCIRFLMVDENNDSIGTIEVLPYIPKEETNLEYYYPFADHPSVKNIQERSTVFELGKMAITENKRNQGFLSKFVDFMFRFSKKYKVDYFVCAMNVEIYRILLLKHKIVFEKLDKKINFGQYGTYPVIIDMKASSERSSN